jgi:hypothetical protein
VSAEEKDQKEQKDIFERLADLGEDAIARLAELPGTGPLSRLLGTMRDRIEDLQHAVAGVQGLERRVEELEQKVAELRGEPPPKVESRKPRVSEPPPPVETPGETEASSGGFVTPAP